MAPKAKPPPAASIEDLFTSLNRHIERAQYDQAVKVADQGSFSLFSNLRLAAESFI